MMRNTLKIVGLLAAGLATHSVSAQNAARPAVAVTVDASKPGHEIPKTLYGVFIEDINHAVEGGIYGELVQNRSFEEGVLPPGMKLTTEPGGVVRMQVEQMPPGTPADKMKLPWPWRENAYWDKNRDLIGWSLRGGGTMKLTEANPMNAASSRSLAVTMAANQNENTPTELINSGFWGIAVKPGTPYKFRCFVRPGTFGGSVTASLRSADGKRIYATHDLGKLQPGEAWAEHATTLTPNAADPNARLVLSFVGGGTLQVDYVSLFPPTFKDHPNGLKKEFGEYIAGLHPSFVRWPGGCYVQGWSHASAPDFRRTLGKPEERPGMYGYWKYRSTDGFGYHEYLQFCQDLKAEPVYCVFAGMTVHPDDNVPMDQLQPYIDNALAAIEYANGPVTSKWGAERAKMGHPEPFGLKYIEIGNEHDTPLYGEYYVKFRDQIKAKYPDMTVIMSMFWSGLNRPAIERAGDANIDMVDEHAYRDVNWARDNFNYFDRYDRNKPWKVFVGEYAGQRGNGDWAGGMADSVYLMMCERNSDLVKMACYAPLFRNVNDTSWPVNLIDFDASRSYAHGSYYVQQVFAENRPDVNLATSYEVTPKPDANTALFAGKVGLGAWDTDVEYKELRVYDDAGKVIYSDNFANLNGFDRPAAGRWSVEGGVLKHTQPHADPAMLLLKALPEFKTGRLTVKARKTGGREGFNLLFNASNRGRFLFCNYGGNGNTIMGIHDRGVPEGLAFRQDRASDGKIENDRWYDLSLTITDDQAEMRLDDQVVARASLKTLPRFFAAGGLVRDENVLVLKMTNYESQAVTADVTLAGVKAVRPGGEQITIKNSDLTSDNNFDQPDRIVPQRRKLDEGGGSFKVELPPFSVNVLKIPVEN